MSTYAEKASFGTPTAYGVPTYDNAEYYRQQAFVTPVFPQSQLAYGAAAQGFGTAAGYVQQQQPMYGYATNISQDARGDARMAPFNPGAPPPNFARPPPQQINKVEDTYQASSNPIGTRLTTSTGGAGLSVFEASAQSSAAYTASWVSSTSSIPPDLKDTPEGSTSAVGSHIGEFGQWNNPEQNFDGTGSAWGTSADAQQTAQPSQQPSANQQLAAQHWPGLAVANEKSAKDKKRDDKDRKMKDEPRELTWEERLRKAQGAKERAENPKFERFERSDGPPVVNNQQENIRPNRGGKPRQSGRGNQRGPREENDGNEADNSAAPPNRDGRWNIGHRRNFNGYPPNGLENEQQHGSHMIDFRGQRGVRGGMIGRGGPLIISPVTTMYPVMFRGNGVPPQGMLPPPPFLPPGAPLNPMIPHSQQDQRFKNSWLDANLFVPPFPMPFPQMVAPMMTGGMRNIRGGIRGGFGRGNMTHRDRGSKKNGENREDKSAKKEEEVNSEEETENTQDPETAQEAHSQDNATIEKTDEQS